MGDDVLDFDGGVEAELRKLRVHGGEHFHRVGAAVEEIRVAEGDVRGTGRHLLRDVGHHHRQRHDAEFALIHRHHRTMAAQMLAAAAGFDEAQASASVGQHQMGVAREFGQAGAVGREKIDFRSCTTGLPAPRMRVARRRRARRTSSGSNSPPRTVLTPRPRSSSGSSVHTGRTRTDAPAAPTRVCAASPRPRCAWRCACRRRAPPGGAGESADRAAAAKGRCSAPRSPPLEPGGGLGQRERLATEFVGIDQHRLERLSCARPAVSSALPSLAGTFSAPSNIAHEHSRCGLAHLHT